MMTGQQPVMSVDEAREFLGLPPIENPSSLAPVVTQAPPPPQRDAPVFNLTMPPAPDTIVHVPGPVAQPDIHISLETPEQKPVTRHVRRDAAGLITEITDG
jgi:hypothetical protein